MRLFVGLGNPGAKYAGNRHNIGFMALDRIAADHGFGPWRKAHQGLAAEGRLGLEKVVLLKPETFMNLSGQSVQSAVSFYKPAGVNTQHPSYTDIMTGDAHIDDVLNRLKASPQWKDMLVVVTYDENGGYWDHVPPPSGPGWGDRQRAGTGSPLLALRTFVRIGFARSAVRPIPARRCSPAHRPILPCWHRRRALSHDNT